MPTRCSPGVSPLPMKPVSWMYLMMFSVLPSPWRNAGIRYERTPRCCR